MDNVHPCVGDCQPSTCPNEWIEYFQRVSLSTENDDVEFAEVYGLMGKWIPFFPKCKLDDAWNKAKTAFDAGLLPHTSHMKISTFAPSRRRSGDDHCLVLYCDSIDEASIEVAGQAIRQLFNYTHKPLCYKTNEQTERGTSATHEAGRNYTYLITSRTGRFMKRDE
jgi:hypothetical protein